MQNFNKSRGLTLIEVLVAVVILGFGLLGIAFLQVYGLRNTIIAGNLEEAALTVNSLATQISNDTTSNSDVDAYINFTISDCAGATLDSSNTVQYNICTAYNQISSIRGGSFSISSTDCDDESTTGTTETCTDVDYTIKISASWTNQTETGAANSDYAVTFVVPKKD